MALTPDERRRRVAELVEQNYSSAAIALALGIGMSTVARDRALLKPHRPIDKADVDRIRTLLAAHRPIADVAREMGCSPAQIRSMFPEYTPRQYTREEKIAILDEFEWLLEGGVWAEAAAARIGMKLPAVCQWYRRLGLKQPRNIAAIARGTDFEEMTAS